MKKMTLWNKTFIIISNKLGLYVKKYTSMSNFMEIYVLNKEIRRF